MAELIIKKKVWNELVEVARRRRQKPESLATQVLREFLQRQIDDDLLARSAQAAKRSSFPMGQTEEIIRQFRARKK